MTYLTALFIQSEMHLDYCVTPGSFIDWEIAELQNVRFATIYGWIKIFDYLNSLFTYSEPARHRETILIKHNKLSF